MNARSCVGYRVMLVIQSLRVGGAENMVENLAYALHNKGCEVKVVALQQGESMVTRRLRKNGINPVFIGKHRGFDPSVIQALSEVMSQFEPDVVHSHLPILHYVNPAASYSGAVNRVHTIHNLARKETKSKIKSAYAKHCYRSGVVVPVALSKVNRQSVVDFYGLSTEQVAVVPNGINLTRFSPKESYAISGVPHICHIGRFQKAKNHSAILDAACLLKQRGIKVVFDLYGEGPLKETICGQATRLGVDDTVVFHGLTDDVPCVMASSDVFILPSLWEGTPMVIAEAMAAGLPIVASKAGGISDMIKSGFDGILCAPTGLSLANHIEHILSSKSLRESLGLAARGKAHEFSADLMAEHYLRVYMENIHG